MRSKNKTEFPLEISNLSVVLSRVHAVKAYCFELALRDTINVPCLAWEVFRAPYGIGANPVVWAI